MKDSRFDSFARELSSGETRRGLFRLLGGAAALGSGLLLAGGDAGARSKGKRRGMAQAGRHGSVAAQRKKAKGKGKGKHKGKKKRKVDHRRIIEPARPRFTVRGREILDPNGNPVLLRGINRLSAWDNEDPDGRRYLPEIARTGANTVRICWAMTTDTYPNGTNPALLDALIANARANRLVPMIELHDASGDWNRLSEMVDYWTQPHIVAIIQKHQSYLLVNIANEAGDYTVSDSQFIAGYTNAVQRMRNAGIHTPLVIDPPDWGKKLDTLNNTAAQLLAADPELNLIFSVHIYWGIAEGKGGQYIKNAFAAAVAANYPLIVGEFSRTGAYDAKLGKSTCGQSGTVDYATIIQQCAQYGIGWYAWEWGPGNSYGGPGCEMMDMTTDSTFANLKNGWAREVAITSPYSIKNTARPIL